MISVTMLTPSKVAKPTRPLKSYTGKIGKGELLWIDVENPTTAELNALKQRFSLDHYAIEDVMHQKQRPKIEEYKNHVFAVIHIPVLKEKKNHIIELFVFFQKNWIITMHSQDTEVIKDVEARIRLRGLAPLTADPTPDLLFYTFLDSAVDAYYPLLDETERDIEALDRQATSAFGQHSKKLDSVVVSMAAIGTLRRRLLHLRGSLAPTRDMLGAIMRGSVPYVQDNSLKSFRDIYDHSFVLMETIDSYRDRTSDVRELFISLVSVSTDNIIKMLTIVATIFLPLSLIAGIYGTNFTPGFFEPGSGSLIGFYFMIVGMIAITGALLLSFKRAGWL